MSRHFRSLCIVGLVSAGAFGCNRGNDQADSNTEAAPGARGTNANGDAGIAGAGNGLGAPAPADVGGDASVPSGGAGGPARDALEGADKDMRKVLDELATLGAKPIDTLSVDEARRQPTLADALKAVLSREDDKDKPKDDLAKVENRTIPTRPANLSVRVYTPKEGKAPYPVIVYYHGGGFVLATNDTYDASARALAKGAKAVTVSVEYRKAPENKFPTAHDDAYAAYSWVVKNAASLAGDPKRIAVAGESAGGNLAASVALTARDKGEPMPVHLLMIYPIATTTTTTPSYREHANAKPLNKAMMTWFLDKYLRTPADGADKRIDLFNANLRGLPPTTIVNAQIDPLRSDGEMLASKLERAEVPVKQKTYDGVTHEFFGLGALVDEAEDAVEFAVDRLEDSFEKAIEESPAPVKPPVTQPTTVPPR